ncbi:hypothetical protein RI367_007228 [Sorochytrium milnesiophthora]
MQHSRTLLLLLALVATCLPHMAFAQTCSSRRVRKEIYDLTPDEAHDLVSGMRTLYTNGFSQKMVDMHVKLLDEAHSTPQFFPWHRVMVWLTETELLKYAPKLQGLPYWDATYQWNNPTSAFPFRNDMMGPVSPAGGCLSGPLSTLTFQGGCVSRLGKPGNWLQPEMLAQLMQNTDYDRFRLGMETSQHAYVHNFINGDMGNVATAPADPMFWLHHGAIDYYWAFWQGVNNNGNFWVYDGQHKGRDVATSDQIGDYTVKQIQDFYNTFCYEYQPPSNAPQNKIPFPIDASLNGGGATPTDTPSNSSNPADSNAGGAVPTNGTLQMPNALPDDFLASFHIDPKQAQQVQDMLKHIFGVLQDEKANGKKLPTLATIAASQSSNTKPTGTTASNPGNDQQSAANAAYALSAAAVAVASLLLL